MRADFIIASLPESVIVNGQNYSINWDFRAGIQFEGIMNSDLGDNEKLCRLLQLYYPRIPANLHEAVERMLWFYRCGEEERKEEKKERYQRRSSKEPAYSFSQDSAYIYAAFKEQYGIDLTIVESLHWWKFMALFESLGEDTKISRIMYYRKASTSGMSKDRRAFINEMKKLYRLNAGSAQMTLQQRNQRLKDYVKERYEKKVM